MSGEYTGNSKNESHWLMCPVCLNVQLISFGEFLRELRSGALRRSLDTVEARSFNCIQCATAEAE